jgi:hypothetical protein
MFTPEVREFLESGCALIVGTVDAGREPHATRGWGLDVVDLDTARLWLDADDPRAIDHLSTVGAIAVTGASVRTLRSVQLKGRASNIRPADSADRKRARRFCDAFFSDIYETDGTDRGVLERLVPRDYVTCTVEVDEVYDQTPGPGAGAPISGDHR